MIRGAQLPVHQTKASILYHRADFDGLFSGAITKMFVTLRDPSTEVTMHPWDYGDPVPEIDPDTDQLYIVDLSVKELMDHPKLVWIDHHKSAISDYSPEIPGYRIDGVAAQRLCWQYFTNPYNMLPVKEDYVSRNVIEPEAIRLAGEYDIWDHRDPAVMEFQYGLHSEEWSLDKLTKNFLTPFLDGKHQLLKNDIKNICDHGRIAMQWHRQFALESLKENGYIVRFEGLTFHCLASCHTRGTTWFPSEGIASEADALMCWRYNGDGVARFGLYHRPGHEFHDLSAIAKKYGGGGHAGACGFEIDVAQCVELGILKLGKVLNC